jgi:hypothetical protein
MSVLGRLEGSMTVSEPVEEEPARAIVEPAAACSMTAELDLHHPDFGDHIERRMALAIDGEIRQDALSEPLRAESEVYLIPRIGGGRTRLRMGSALFRDRLHPGCSRELTRSAQLLPTWVNILLRTSLPLAW